MTEQFTEIRELLLSMVNQTAEAVVLYLPKLVGALFILILGWLFARVLRAVLERSVSAGLDGILERTGATRALEQTSMTATPSEIVGGVAYWLIMIGVFMAASEILGLEAVSSAIARIFSYIPNVISAALVLAAGVFLARFVGNLVTSGAAAANVSYAEGLGAVARMAIVVMVGVVTLEQLGVDTQILITVITVTVAAITAGMGLAFALGAKDVMRSILAGHYLRQTLPTEDELEFDGERGVVEEIGPVHTVFRSGDRRVRIPNGRLVDEVIK